MSADQYCHVSEADIYKAIDAVSFDRISRSEHFTAKCHFAYADSVKKEIEEKHGTLCPVCLSSIMEKDINAMIFDERFSNFLTVGRNDYSYPKVHKECEEFARVLQNITDFKSGRYMKSFLKKLYAHVSEVDQPLRAIPGKSFNDISIAYGFLSYDEISQHDMVIL